MWKKLALLGSILVSLCFGIGIDFYHILALLLILSKRQIVRVAVGLQGDALRRGIAISQHLLLGKMASKAPKRKEVHHFQSKTAGRADAPAFFVRTQHSSLSSYKPTRAAT